MPDSASHQEKRYRVNEPQVVAQIIEGEAIIVNLTNGNYYSLLDTGAEVWRGIENRVPVPEIVTGLATRYKASSHVIEEAVGVLIEDLESEDLVARCTDRDPRLESQADSEAWEEPNLEFAPPKLEKFQDMADLILLDPIHEVGPAGWPQPKSESAGS